MGNKQQGIELDFTVEGQGPETLIVFERLGLTNPAVKHLYDMFCLIDEDHDGYITVEELFHHFNRFEEGPFARLIFPKDRLNFEDFVVYIWDFLSDNIAHFAFRKYDKHNQCKLHLSVIKRIAECVYGIEHDYLVVKEAIEALPTDEHGDITLRQFMNYMDTSHGHHNHQQNQNHVILKPLYDFQRTLRQSLWNEIYWEDISRRRMKLLPNKTVDEILNLTEEQYSDIALSHTVLVADGYDMHLPDNQLEHVVKGDLG